MNFLHNDARSASDTILYKSLSIVAPEENMATAKKKSLLENVAVLIIVAVLAGVAGGSAVGFITGKSTSSTSTAH